MLTPRITAHNDSIIPTMYSEGWILITIHDNKMYWHREEKKPRERKILASDDFQEFWNLYPVERRKRKKESRDIWSRLDSKTKEIAIQAIKDHKEYWKRTNQDMNFIPLAYYWLKGERYTDEGIKSQNAPTHVIKLKEELEEDKKLEDEKKAMNEKIRKLRLDPVKWKELEEKALSQLTESQRTGQFKDRLLDTRIRMILSNN